MEFDVIVAVIVILFSCLCQIGETSQVSHLILLEDTIS